VSFKAVNDAMRDAHQRNTLLREALGERVTELATLRADNARLREALEELAEQTLTAEMTQGHRAIADYEGAYNSMIGVARAALAPQEPGR